MAKYTEETVKQANEYLIKSKLGKWELNQNGTLELVNVDFVNIDRYGLYLTKENLTVINEAIDLLEQSTTPCSKCSKPSTHKCTDTPAGGWGTMKCGSPLCDECACGCKDVTTY